MRAKKRSLQASEKAGPHFRPMIDQFDNHLSDSGFKSNCYQEKRKSSEKLGANKMEIPHMLSFVGGAFTVQLYKSAVRISKNNFTNKKNSFNTFQLLGGDRFNFSQKCASSISANDATEFLLCSRCG